MRCFLRSLSFVVIFCSCLPQILKADSKISIGIPIALTGDATTWGSDVKNSLVLANEYLFDNKYALTIEDDQCNPKKGVSAVTKLISIDKVQYILGMTCSGVTLSAAPVIEKNKVLAITASSSADAVTQAGDYVFRTFPSDIQGVEIISTFMRKNYKRIAVISEETDYAQGLLKGLQTVNKESSIELYNENYLPGDTDYRSLYAKVLLKKPDAIFLNPQSDSTLVFMVQQLRDLNKSIPIIAHIYPSSPTFLNGAGRLSEGIVFADTPALKDFHSPKADQFKDEFQKRFGQQKSIETVLITAVSAFQALDEAIRSGQPVKDYLYSHTFNGIGGPFSFDRNGDVVGIGFVLKKIEGQMPKTIPIS